MDRKRRGPQRPAVARVAEMAQAPESAPPVPSRICRSTSGAGLVLAEPDPRRVRHVRLRHRVRRRRRRPAPRGDLLQGHDAQAADRQRHAARDRDTGRDAELDRPPEPGRRRRHREVRRERGPAGRVPVIVNVAGRVGRATTSRSPAGSTASPASPASSSTSAARTSARAVSSSRSTPYAAGEVTAAVRRATDLPLLVKLSPNVADVRPIARAIADAGADALTAINTLSGIAVAPSRAEAPARQHLRRPVGAGDQAGRAADRLRGRPGRRSSRSSRSAASPSSPTSSTSSRSAPSRSRSAPRSSPTRRCRSASSTSSQAECRRRGAASHRDLVGTALPRKPGAPSAKGVEYRP